MQPTKEERKFALEHDGKVDGWYPPTKERLRQLLAENDSVAGAALRSVLEGIIEMLPDNA